MKTYWRILRYAIPYKRQIIAYLLATIFSVVFTTLTFVLIQPLLEVLFEEKGNYNQSASGLLGSLDNLMAFIQNTAMSIKAEHSPTQALLFVTIIVVVCNLLGNVFKFFSSYFLGTLRTKIIQDIRSDSYNTMIGKDVAFLENSRKGDLLTRLTSDITEIEYGIVVSLEGLIRDPITIIYVLAIMLYKSWELTLFIFAILPVSAYFTGRITKKLKKEAQETQSMLGQLMTVAEETISGIRVILAFNAINYLKNIFYTINAKHSHITRRQWHRRALVPIFSESAMVLVVGLVLWFGGRQVFSGQLGKGEFIAYLGLFFVLSRPAKSLGQAFSNIFKGVASADRVFALIDKANQVVDEPDAKSISTFNKSIQILNVDFTYSTGEQVITNLSVNIQKGKTYGIVGTSGSGKSTLVELIMRFYDVDSGSIKIDNLNIKEVKQSELRQLMGVVTQDPVLVNDSFYNNIVFGLQGVTPEQVTVAAKLAYAHDFIMENEAGYNTFVGDRGGLLSGGQRQRISIARAFLRKPEILILDEATSALDNVSEALVQKSIKEVMQGKTIIIIAHRLSTIHHADEIWVMRKGELVEKGTHIELLASNGIYQNLHQMQEHSR
ncbi:MAG: ABC transporter ATP-binding protein [Bacteroidota bacterium]|nr:ABC transporter ATP-binding protein [Bacteroidota bacterium]